MRRGSLHANVRAIVLGASLIAALTQCGLILGASDYGIETSDADVDSAKDATVDVSLVDGGTNSRDVGADENATDARMDAAPDSAPTNVAVDGGPQCMPQALTSQMVVSCDIECPLPQFCCLNYYADICYDRDPSSIATCVAGPNNPIPGVPDYCDTTSDCCPGTVCCAFTTGSSNWPTVSLIECVPRAQCPAPNQRRCDPGVSAQCDAGETCQTDGLLNDTICK